MHPASLWYRSVHLARNVNSELKSHFVLYDKQTESFKYIRRKPGGWDSEREKSNVVAHRFKLNQKRQSGGGSVRYARMTLVARIWSLRCHILADGTSGNLTQGPWVWTNKRLIALAPDTTVTRRKPDGTRNIGCYTARLRISSAMTTGDTDYQ